MDLFHGDVELVPRRRAGEEFEWVDRIVVWGRVDGVGRHRATKVKELDGIGDMGHLDVEEG